MAERESQRKQVDCLPTQYQVGPAPSTPWGVLLPHSRGMLSKMSAWEGSEKAIFSKV